MLQNTDSVMYVHIQVNRSHRGCFPTHTYIGRYVSMKTQENRVPSVAMYLCMYI